MVHAINALIQVPQNNFRVFKNGLLVYAENKDADLFKIMQQIFENTDESSERY